MVGLIIMVQTPDLSLLRPWTNIAEQLVINPTCSCIVYLSRSYLPCFSYQVTLNAEQSKDTDFLSLDHASPIFYWFCRNSSEPKFDTSGNVAAIKVVSIPELDGDGIHNISEVNVIPSFNLLFFTLIVAYYVCL